MRLQTAAFCLWAITFFPHASQASAHISFSADLECVDSYKKDCILWGAGQTRRTMLIFFDGTEAENGFRCEKSTAALALGLSNSLRAQGLVLDAVTITSASYSNTWVRRNESVYRCSYVVESKRRDLRFQTHYYNRPFRTKYGEEKGTCVVDVRKAQATPGSIGAAQWMSAPLAKNELCYTSYATLGLDRVETGSDGAERLIKFGSKKSDHAHPRSDDFINR